MRSTRKFLVACLAVLMAVSLAWAAEEDPDAKAAPAPAAGSSDAPAPLEMKGMFPADGKAYKGQLIAVEVSRVDLTKPEFNLLVVPTEPVAPATEPTPVEVRAQGYWDIGAGKVVTALLFRVPDKAISGMLKFKMQQTGELSTKNLPVEIEEAPAVLNDEALPLMHPAFEFADRNPTLIGFDRKKVKVGDFLYANVDLGKSGFDPTHPERNKFYFPGMAPTTPSSPPPPDSGGGGVVPASYWTCTMHPEVNQPNPGKCPKCGMDLVQANNPDLTTTIPTPPTGLAEEGPQAGIPEEDKGTAATPASGEDAVPAPIVVPALGWWTVKYTDKDGKEKSAVYLRVKVPEGAATGKVMFGYKELKSAGVDLKIATESDKPTYPIALAEILPPGPTTNATPAAKKVKKPKRMMGSSCARTESGSGLLASLLILALVLAATRTRASRV